MCINQIDGVSNCHGTVAKQFRQARRADLVIAYVQQSGVYLLKKYIANTNLEIRLVCSFDMEITGLLAVRQLVDMGVTVKIYQAPRGTLHAKLWLFEDANGGRTDIYRNLSSQTRQQFDDDMNAHFQEKLEHTAKSVRTNYDKHIKHTMSALGWCEKLQYDAEGYELRLNKYRRAQE